MEIEVEPAVRNDNHFADGFHQLEFLDEMIENGLPTQLQKRLRNVLRQRIKSCPEPSRENNGFHI